MLSADSVRSLFQRDETEAILLVDASNAFNSLNCLSALHHLQTLSLTAYNCYRVPTELFVNSEVLHSSEGTTQGDPLAITMYAIVTIPLIKKLLLMMSTKSGMQTSHLQLAKFPDYDIGGIYFPHKALDLTTLLMPPKLD